MDIAQIRRLIKLIEETDITEIEVGEGENKVRISRQSQIMMAAPAAMQAPMMAAPHAAVAPVAPVAEEVDNKNHFEAPMVGTFYSSASPDAASFVEVGSKVKKGDVLCIIEAMKLMNEIEAEYDGTIEALLVENATPIEYGQALFSITPA
ncbi:MAG: acetyl-CoA carboxylase biotin carboxyl carrier protein [Mariprofundaceae bacterium]|nr:acetyl-CoA carboxylase biotin carboxyl carrier protein [Mariprofundaceae bacterium]